MPSYAVIIVSYRVPGLLRRCLQTVLAQDPPASECWVVDNASGDGSAELVRSEFPGVRLLAESENLGFARANNKAMRQSRADTFVLLNPDTELPPGALAVMQREWERHPGAALMGVGLSNPDGSPQPSRFAFPTVANLIVESLGLHRGFVHLGFGTPSLAPERAQRTAPAGWVSGACMLASREWFEASGGFEESLFMYGEDLEWCWRAHVAHRPVLHTTCTRVLHHGGASGVEARGALFVRNIEGRLAFVARHRPRGHHALARFATVVGAALRFAYWRTRATWERPASGRTREQIERFRAVLDWAREGRA